MKSTVERIEMLGGKILPGTAEEVDLAALDGRGQLSEGRSEVT
jgi:hypothetical protein